MSDENIITVRVKPDGSAWQVMDDGSLQPMERQTDWERFDAFTEEEIEAQRLEDLDEFDDDYAIEIKTPRVREIREKLGLSTMEFAERFQLDPWLVEKWDTRETPIDPTSQLYLSVIDVHPEAVVEAIRAYRIPRGRKVLDSAEPEPMPRKKRKSA